MGQGPPLPYPTLPFMTSPPTCAHNEHVGAAAVASTWRDTLGHHLGPSLQLQGLGIAREWGASGSWGPWPTSRCQHLTSPASSPLTLLPSHITELLSQGFAHAVP